MNFVPPGWHFASRSSSPTPLVPTCYPQLGIALVGTSSIMSGEGSATHHVTSEEMLMGMGLIIASQVGGSGLKTGGG